jgi:ribonuclease HI
MTADNPVYIYVDAARDDEVSGIGYSISGEFSTYGKKFMVGNYTSMEAEFHALVEAVRVASMESSHREYCEVHTDAQPLTTKLCGSQDESGDWSDYRESAHWLLDKFDSWDVVYTSRSSNETAHGLARKALFNGREHLDERYK